MTRPSDPGTPPATGDVVPCFTPGTLIATATGPVPAERIRPGDRVITRDNGLQEVAWTGAQTIGHARLRQDSALRPVLIRKGALGRELPERDMLVSPDHRVLMANERTEILFGDPEVLVAARHLAGLAGIARAQALGVTYVHFMCARHEVVLSDGAWSESFQPLESALCGIGPERRQDIVALFPDLATARGRDAVAPARKTLTQHVSAFLTGD